MRPVATAVVLTSLSAAADQKATLLVDSDPPAAEVFIDGIDSGYATPTHAIFLPPGRHTVEIRDAAGHASAAQTIDLAAPLVPRLPEARPLKAATAPLKAATAPSDRTRR